MNTESQNDLDELIATLQGIRAGRAWEITHPEEAGDWAPAGDTDPVEWLGQGGQIRLKQEDTMQEWAGTTPADSCRHCGASRTYHTRGGAHYGCDTEFRSSTSEWVRSHYCHSREAYERDIRDLRAQVAAGLAAVRQAQDALRRASTQPYGPFWVGIEPVTESRAALTALNAAFGELKPSPRQ